MYTMCIYCCFLTGIGCKKLVVKDERGDGDESAFTVYFKGEELQFFVDIFSKLKKFFCPKLSCKEICFVLRLYAKNSVA